MMMVKGGWYVWVGVVVRLEVVGEAQQQLGGVTRY
jgi:hypothetical protein